MNMNDPFFNIKSPLFCFIHFPLLGNIKELCSCFDTQTVFCFQMHSRITKISRQGGCRLLQYINARKTRPFTIHYANMF